MCSYIQFLLLTSINQKFLLLTPNPSSYLECADLGCFRSLSPFQYRCQDDGGVFKHPFIYNMLHMYFSFM